MQTSESSDRIVNRRTVRLNKNTFFYSKLPSINLSSIDSRPPRVMAFLRSVTRCNSLVSRKISAAAPTSSSQVRDCEWSLKSSRAELLSCHRYYVDLRRELNTCRHVSSSARVAAEAAAATPTRNPSPPPPIVQNPTRDPLDVSFNDPVAAFKSKTTWELVRAYMVYVMCSSEYLVDNNIKVSRTEQKLFD